VTDAIASRKRLAAISGRRSAGKRHHHDQLADLPSLWRVRNWTKLAVVSPPKECLSRDLQRLSCALINERVRFFWRHEVNPRKRLSSWLIGAPLKSP
jgi:hypothetical protein